MTVTGQQAADLDAHIDQLLRGEATSPSAGGGDGETDALIATARLLHAVLPRFHPRFGFEDALAARLTGRAGNDDEPIPFPAAAISDRADDVRRVWERYRRELVAGGAIASGVSIAIPLAGAALVRWRRSRSSGPAGGIF